MKTFQIVVLSNRVKDTLVVHAMESYRDMGYPYSCILDVSFPEGRVLRTVGFSDKEKQFLIRYLTQNMSKIQQYSDKDIPLLFNCSLKAATNFQRVALEDAYG